MRFSVAAFSCQWDDTSESGTGDVPVQLLQKQGPISITRIFKSPMILHTIILRGNVITSLLILGIHVERKKVRHEIACLDLSTASHDPSVLGAPQDDLFINGKNTVVLRMILSVNVGFVVRRYVQTEVVDGFFRT